MNPKWQRRISNDLYCHVINQILNADVYGSLKRLKQLCCHTHQHRNLRGVYFWSSWEIRGGSHVTHIYAVPLFVHLHGIGWAVAVIPVLVWAPHCNVTVPKTKYTSELRSYKNKMQILKLIAQVKNQEKSLFWQNLTLRFYFQDSTHVRLKGHYRTRTLISALKLGWKHTWTFPSLFSWGLSADLFWLDMLKCGLPRVQI